jgi:hypothetical protein
VRVWIDISAPAHVLVFRPLIALLRDRGDEVAVTSRRYKQAVELLRLHGIDAELIGAHGGGSLAGKLTAMVGRLPALIRWARGRRFDVALAHGSHELALAARSLRIPCATTFDYEFATVQHWLGCHAATRVVVPEAIPPERLARFGARPPKLRRYPGLKEEYYLADFEPDPRVPETLGIDPGRVLVTVRTPADFALYHHQIENTLFPRLLQRLGGDSEAHAVVLPRNDAQREAIRALRLPSLIVPDAAIDAQSLIALSDVVVSAGGTMNREAAALGVPVYTTFAGRLGGVDEWLIREGRLRTLGDPSSLALTKRASDGERVRRDPAAMLELLLSGLRPAASPNA